MHAVLILTLESYTRTVHLSHSERVVGLDAQHALNTTTLLFGMGLGTNTQSAELGGTGVYPLLLEYLCQTNGVRRNGVEAGGSEVLDELDLALRVTSCCRNGHSTEPFGTVLETKSTGKHSITR